MGRKVTPREPITDKRRRTWDAFKATAKYPLPRGPLLLQTVVRALLKRVERSNPHEGKELSLIVHTLAAHEYRIRRVLGNGLCDALMPMESIVRPLLRYMASEKRSRLTHWPVLLSAQRDMIVEYEREYPYPVHTPAFRERWLTKHAQPLHERLTVIPCLHPYGELVSARDELITCRGVGDLIAVLLATLHGTTPNYVQRLLKRMPR